MKKSLITFLVLAVIILTAIFTNPDLIKHKEVIKNKVSSYMQHKIKENSKTSDAEWEEMRQKIGVVLGGPIIEDLVDKIVSTNNYLLFSTTKLTWDGKSKVIGIGAFGDILLTTTMDEGLIDQVLQSNKTDNSESTDRSDTSLNFLKDMNGKHTFHVKLFDNPSFSNRVKKIIGSRFEFLKETWAVEPPMEFVNNVFSATGCQEHNCPENNFVIVYDFTTDVMSVGIHEAWKITTYSENGIIPPQIFDWIRY
jgi:Domain of unknown function (DUF4359)